MNKIRRTDYVAADHILWDSAKYRKKRKSMYFIYPFTKHLKNRLFYFKDDCFL